MAMVILAADIWIKKIKKPLASEIPRLIMVDHIERAQNMIFKMVQYQSFENEIRSLKCNTRMVSKSSCLFKLDPFLDSNGLLRVGGRLKKSMLGINEMHPAILPKGKLITEAIVR